MSNITSVYFLGILFMALSCVLFLTVFFPSWFAGPPRRFWVTRLTYHNDKDQQSFVRFMWVLAWCTALLGSLLVSWNDERLPQTFGWILAGAIFSIVSVWAISKVIVAFIILVAWIIDWVKGKNQLLPK